MISKQDKIKAEKIANNSQLIEKTRQRFALVDLIRKTQRRKRRQVLCVCVPLSFDKVVTHGCYWNIKPHSGGQEFEWEACRRTHTHTHTRETQYTGASHIDDDGCRVLITTNHILGPLSFFFSHCLTASRLDRYSTYCTAYRLYSQGELVPDLHRRCAVRALFALSVGVITQLAMILFLFFFFFFLLYRVIRDDPPQCI